MSERGKYIVIEGHDGTGKSSLVDRLGQKLGSLGISSIHVHEPGGAPLADDLRHLIKNGNLERDAWTNVLLFTAARRAAWLQTIEPALDQGQWVLAERNWYSTIAYQSYGEGEPIEPIEEITRKNVGDRYVNPDLAFILDVRDHDERRRRIGERGTLEKPDAFESMPDDFQERVKEGYVRFANERGITVIDASPSISEVEDKIWEYISPLVEEVQHEAIPGSTA
jgi:dTMP kinase